LPENATGIGGGTGEGKGGGGTCGGQLISFTDQLQRDFPQHQTTDLPAIM